MVPFFFICALMVLLALWLILPPLWQSAGDAKVDDARAANLLVYQDQLRELQADLKTGLLTQTQYDQDKEEIERRLLEDVGDEKRSASPKMLANRRLAYAVAVFIPVAAILFYIFVGSPRLIDATPTPPSTLQRR
ncbi:MAG TPA: c-type cytochrome biogenesis protein CcmI [Pyrinomonadaceae bacterium]|jgi:cytochrome c-type biogenesis protein CcmH|nr:c-type cytochrome biogenesis protein CcmI [Pyrinomonadaceae bacterium]